MIKKKRKHSSSPYSSLCFLDGKCYKQNKEKELGKKSFSFPEIVLPESSSPQCTFSLRTKGKSSPLWWKFSARTELEDRWKTTDLSSVRWPSSRSKGQAGRQLLSLLPRKKSLEYWALDQLKTSLVFQTIYRTLDISEGWKDKFLSPNWSHLTLQAEDVETSVTVSSSTFPLSTVRSKKNQNTYFFCLSMSEDLSDKAIYLTWLTTLGTPAQNYLRQKATQTPLKPELWKSYTFSEECFQCLGQHLL